MSISREERLRKSIEPALYKCLTIPQARRRQRRTVRTIRTRGHASVVFIVSSLPMWRAQGLYALLHADARFDVHLALYPFSSYGEAQKRQAMAELSAHCADNGLDFVDLSGEEHPGEALRRRLHPDILFYPQPYNHLYANDLDARNFPESLVCYIPYSIRTSAGEWVYRSWLNETAWRLFYASDIHRREAAEVLYNKGSNIRVTGDLLMDTLTAPAGKDVWKPQDTPKKRIIWAPHFSIVDAGMLHRDSFSWLSECMPRIAARYRDCVQFAFKPHPRLLTELYAHPDWGKEKADAYYRAWETGANTQLVTGSYVDLFKTSDAMIHDSASFTVEYHFTGKPVLFTTRDLDASLKGQNALGQAGILAHYPGRSEQDIVSFIDFVVLSGNDPKKEERAAFVASCFRPSGKGSVAQTIYQEILNGLGFNG